MKRILFLTLLFCTVAAGAQAAAPEAALQALILGNEKFALQQSLEPSTLAIVVADPAIDVPVADLFGLPESRLAVIKPADFGPATSLAVKDADLTAPLVVVLGRDADAVWAVYANIVQSSPDLIHAVLKGQVSAQGAVMDAGGMVTVLGAHPELQTLVGRYLLGAAAPAEQQAVAEAPEETAEVPAEAAPEAAVEEQDAAPAEHAMTQESAVQPENDAAHAEAAPAAKAQEAQSSGGGSGLLIVVLFIAALVGTIVYMDKTVLKP